MKYRQIYYIVIIFILCGALYGNLHAETIYYYKQQSIVTDHIEAGEVFTEKIEPEVIEKNRLVPFYSQFDDISKANWKKVACGIASVAMIIDYYGESVSPDYLLDLGIKRGAYIDSAGWSHAGLIGLANDYNLGGQTVTLYHLSLNGAYQALVEELKEGPVIVSVHYTFDPKNPIPHLVVINDTDENYVYYNDPAEKSGNGKISINKFKSSWKKRYIEIRPLS